MLFKAAQTRLTVYRHRLHQKFEITEKNSKVHSAAFTSRLQRSGSEEAGQG